MHSKLVVALGIALLLNGCAVFHHHPKIRAQTSHADGMQQVWITPRMTNCGKSAICSALGGGWTSNAPEHAVLVVQTQGGYAAIHDAVLDIDGRQVPLTEAPLPTRYSEMAHQDHRDDSVARQLAGETSTRGFQTTLDVLRQVIAARRVTLSVHTAKRTIDSVLFDDDVDSDAHRGIVALVDDVHDVAKANDK